MKPFLIRSIAVSALLAMMGCRWSRTVKIGWDAPATPPEGYRIMVDERVVLEIKPPPIDSRCNCMNVAVTVPRGRHTVSVIAYKGSDLSPRASLTVE